MESSPNRPRVAVVFGGRSSEHAISCVTAGSVLKAIDPERYDVVPVGITADGRWVLESGDPERLALTSADRLPEVDASRATVALSNEDGSSRLVVHEPIATAGLSGSDARAFGERVRQVLAPVAESDVDVPSPDTHAVPRLA